MAKNVSTKLAPIEVVGSVLQCVNRQQVGHVNSRPGPLILGKKNRFGLSGPQKFLVGKQNFGGLLHCKT